MVQEAARGCTSWQVGDFGGTGLCWRGGERGRGAHAIGSKVQGGDVGGSRGGSRSFMYKAASIGTVPIDARSEGLVTKLPSLAIKKNNAVHRNQLQTRLKQLSAHPLNSKVVSLATGPAQSRLQRCLAVVSRWNTNALNSRDNKRTNPFKGDSLYPFL